MLITSWNAAELRMKIRGELRLAGSLPDY